MGEADRAPGRAKAEEDATKSGDEVTRQLGCRRPGRGRFPAAQRPSGVSFRFLRSCCPAPAISSTASTLQAGVATIVSSRSRGGRAARTLRGWDRAPSLRVRSSAIGSSGSRRRRSHSPLRSWPACSPISFPLPMSRLTESTSRPATSSVASTEVTAADPGDAGNRRHLDANKAKEAKCPSEQ